MKCEFCKEKEGTEPIREIGTSKDVYICEECDKEQDWTTE